MSFVNYVNVVLRASAVDAGPSGQGAAVTLPETVNELWVMTDKTAENAADNLLTVRLQAQVNAVWYDVAWDANQITGVLGTAGDTATDVTRTPNILDAFTAAATVTMLTHYKNLPSNVVRSIFVSSGTGTGGVDLGTMNTFSVAASYSHFKQ